MDETFLTEQQIWGDDQGNGQLQVMKSYGTKTGLSDLAIVLGGLMGSSSKTSDNQRTGDVWSASSDGYGYVRTVAYGGVRFYWYPGKRLMGARPALPSSVTSKIQLTSDMSAEALAKGEARLTRKITGLGGKEIQVVEYGEYPQTIAKPDAAKELNGLSTHELEKIKTGKKYTFDGEKYDGEKYDADDKPFKAKEVDEYQYKGENYIRVEAHPQVESFLSNGHRVEYGEKYWIEVKPIEWLVDPSGWWVARQALFSGVQFDRNQQYNGDFDKTDMKQYLDKYFAKEMLAGRNVSTPAVVGASTAAVTARRDTQRV
jgi:hypothetical protein